MQWCQRIAKVQKSEKLTSEAVRLREEPKDRSRQASLSGSAAVHGGRPSGQLRQNLENGCTEGLRDSHAQPRWRIFRRKEQRQPVSHLKYQQTQRSSLSVSSAGANTLVSRTHSSGWMPVRSHPVPRTSCL